MYSVESSKSMKVSSAENESMAGETWQGSVGMTVWVFGLVERATNRIILVPVDRRDADTLIPIIQKYVTPGSTIYSDGWSAYLPLNELGYQHFSVIHKQAYTKRYVNEATQEVVVHTNTVEGAWAH